MGGRKNKGKSMKKLKEIVKENSLQVEIEPNKTVKIVIDKKYVDDYIKKKTTACAARNASIIVIDSSDDENDDVIFVKNIKPREMSPKMKLISMQQEIGILKRQNREMGKRFKDMQSDLFNLQNQNNQNQNAIFMEPNASLVLSATDEEWLQHELNNMINNGENENAFSDLLNENDD